MSVIFQFITIFVTLKLTKGFTISQIYGEEVLDQWNVFVSGPFGSKSEKDGEFFTDFR